MIGDVPAAHVDRHRASPSLEAPARVDRVLAERDAAVRGQLARMRGPAVPRQVGRRRAHHVLDAHQLPADQARRRIVSDPKHDVDLVVDRIELAVVELQHHVDGGMRRQEIGNVGVDQEAAQRARRADPDRAGRLGRAAFGQRHHRLRGGHQLAGMTQHLQALVAESQPARAAQDQPRSERALQPRDRAAHRRGRRAEPARGLGEAAGLRDLDEGRHLVHQRRNLICAHGEQVLARSRVLSAGARLRTIGAPDSLRILCRFPADSP